MAEENIEKVDIDIVNVNRIDVKVPNVLDVEQQNLICYFAENEDTEDVLNDTSSNGFDSS